MKDLKIGNVRKKNKTTRVIIVRHGETVGNIEGGFQGRTDSALTPKGERQAFLAAQRLKDQNITKIYSSPLSRAIKTAEIIRGTHDIEILTDDRLLEIDCGEWEGKSYDEANEMFPESMYEWEQEPHKHVMPGGESISQVLERVSEVFKEVVSDNSGNKYVMRYPSSLLRHIEHKHSLESKNEK